MTPSRSASLRRSAGAWNPLTLALLAGLWIGSVGNWPLWWTLVRLPEMATSRGALFIAAFGLMVATLSAGLLALVAWRRAVKPVIAFFMLSAAIGAYFMGAYGIVLDPTMMINVLQTDPREVGDLLSPQLLANLALIAVAPILWLCVRRCAQRPSRRRRCATQSGSWVARCF